MFDEPTKMRPCPFCGSEKVYMRERGAYLVTCLTCNAEGPEELEMQKAANGWNLRVNEEKIIKRLTLQKQSHDHAYEDLNHYERGETDGWNLAVEKLEEIKALILRENENENP